MQSESKFWYLLSLILHLAFAMHFSLIPDSSELPSANHQYTVMLQTDEPLYVKFYQRRGFIWRLFASQQGHHDNRHSLWQGIIVAKPVISGPTEIASNKSIASILF